MVSFASLPHQEFARLSAPPTTVNGTLSKPLKAAPRQTSVDPALLEMQNPVDRPRSLKIKFKNPTWNTKDKEQLPVRQPSMEIDSPKRRRMSPSPPVVVSHSMMSAQMTSLVEQEETPIIKPEPACEHSSQKLLIPDDGLDETSPFASLYPPLAEVPNRRAESCPPSLPNPTFLEPISATTSETQDSIFSSADSASSQSSTRSNMLSVLCVLASMKQKQQYAEQDSMLKLKPVNLQWNGAFPCSPFSSAQDLTKQALERKALQNKRRAALRAQATEEPDSESNSSLSELSESEEESELSSLDDLEIISPPKAAVEMAQEAPKREISVELLPPSEASDTLQQPAMLAKDLLTPSPLLPAKPTSTSIRSSAPQELKPKMPNLGLTVLRPTAKHYRRTQPDQIPSSKKKKSNKDWVTDSKKRKRKSEPKRTAKRGKANVWGKKEEAWAGGEFDFYVDVPALPKEFRPKKKKGPKWYYQEIDDVPAASTSQLPPSRRSTSILALPPRRSRSRSSRPVTAAQQDLSAVLDSAIDNIPQEHDMNISLNHDIDASAQDPDISINQQSMDIPVPSRAASQIPTESSIASLSFRSISTTAYATPPTSDDIIIQDHVPIPQFSHFLYGTELYPEQNDRIPIVQM